MKTANGRRSPDEERMQQLVELLADALRILQRIYDQTGALDLEPLLKRGRPIIESHGLRLR